MERFTSNKSNGDLLSPLLDIGYEKPSSNLNLLLAAAVAGAQTDEDNSSSDEGDLEPLTFDKAMELWMRHKTPKGEALFLATSGVTRVEWSSRCSPRAVFPPRVACRARRVYLAYSNRLFRIVQGIISKKSVRAHFMTLTHASILSN